MTYSIEDQINFEATKDTKDTTLIELIVKAEEQIEEEQLKNYPNMLIESQAMAFWMVNKAFHIRRLEEQVKNMFADIEKMREIIKSLKRELEGDS